MSIFISVPTLLLVSRPSVSLSRLTLIRWPSEFLSLSAFSVSFSLVSVSLTGFGGAGRGRPARTSEPWKVTHDP